MCFLIFYEYFCGSYARVIVGRHLIAIRSCISEDKKIALAYIQQLEKAKIFPRPIVTRVDPDKGFYAAEAYHQDFLINNPRYPYIVYNDLPKVRNLKQLFPAMYRDQPVTVASTNAGG